MIPCMPMLTKNKNNNFGHAAWAIKRENWTKNHIWNGPSSK